MDFEYAPEQEAFRKEFRAFLAAHLPADLRVDDPVDDLVASNREMVERRVAWQETIHKAGWAGIAWRKEDRGREAAIIGRAVWDGNESEAPAPHHFNEVFSTDVMVPKSQLLGPLNAGWKVSTTTLMYERHSSGARNPVGQVRDLITVARRLPVDGRTAWDDPRIRQRLSQLLIDCEAMKYTRFRALTRQIRGGAPGPEGSILKLSGPEIGVSIADAAGELLGMHALVNQGTELVPDAPRWFNRLGAGRQYTISAGTSEIQRNIIGERVLGLPKG